MADQVSSGDGPELRTDRLLLRAWEPADLAAFAAINADPRARRWYPGVEDRATSDASVQHFRALHARYGFTFWAVEVLESVRGPRTLHRIDRSDHPQFRPAVRAC